MKSKQHKNDTERFKSLNPKENVQFMIGKQKLVNSK